MTNLIRIVRILLNNRVNHDYYRIYDASLRRGRLKKHRRTCHKGTAWIRLAPRLRVNCELETDKCVIYSAEEEKRITYKRELLGPRLDNRALSSADAEILASDVDKV